LKEIYMLPILGALVGPIAGDLLGGVAKQLLPGAAGEAASGILSAVTNPLGAVTGLASNLLGQVGGKVGALI
jgi:hypothetical protein